MQKIESDTWYDATGRIVFTCSTNLPGVGYDRKQWENAGAVQPVRRGDAPYIAVAR